jgi:HlyB family type I secretion system ABC transporter
VDQPNEPTDYQPEHDGSSSGHAPHEVGIDTPVLARLRSVIAAARYHGVEMDARDFRGTVGEDSPSPATLVTWLRDQGMIAKAMRLKWRHIVRMQEQPPLVLLFRDGSAGVMVGADPTRNIVWLKDPLRNDAEPAVAVDELRLQQVWTGDVVLVRRARDAAEDEQPFNIRWLFKLCMHEKKGLRDIAIASMTTSVLTILPALIVMQVINQVLQFRSMSTLVTMSMIIVVLVLFETLLGWARREITNVIAVRIDVRLQLHIFARLLSLPLEYFERNQAGMTIMRVSSVYRLRTFITGRLMGVFLDSFTLVVLLPFLFWLEPTLAWLIVACAGLVGVIIVCFIGPLSRLAGMTAYRNNQKGSVLYETVAGIRTVKTLALEPVRKSEWDQLVASAAQAGLEETRLSNTVNTLVTPLERFMNFGIILVGAYLVLENVSGVEVGGLVAFMMLGGRVAAPLVSFARLLEDLNEVKAALGEAGAVLNQPTETKALTTGMRPEIKGAVAFNDVNFAYPGSDTLALDRVNFSIPAGTMLGVVGRSGSGKSTLTRLLQGVSRGYTGHLRLDGVDLREINLTHLRRSLGVVLQDNFLFRGTVRDNITAGRAGLSIEDVVRAARLAGAEEFIERMPAGYETWIEEGSTNISGGQKQRLAIARALISDPKLMILDEATSALDPESEALVNANLQRIAKGRTMVIVSHRLSSLVDCDQICVMDKGRVQDIGPHNVLVERCAIYRQLWLQQNRHLDPQRGGNTGPAPVLAQGDD